MTIAVFSTKPYDQEYLSKANVGQKITYKFYEEGLTPSSAVLAKGADGVCLFVNDKGDDDVLSLLSSMGIKLVVLRCAGYNNIDLNSAKKWGITVLRVPSYSPHSVAEHALGLMLALNRKIPKAFMRVREGNFSLAGLMGFDMYGKTVGIIGVGRIGKALSRILNAMGCRVLGVDRTHKIGAKENGVEYVGLDELLKESSIISLHCPLTPQTYHLINDDTLKLTQQGVMIINTGRGGLVDTSSLIRFLKNGHIGYLGLDVYEQECGIFFEDLSCQGIEDDLIARLVTFSNVLITSHQGFFTHEAMEAIGRVTYENVVHYGDGEVNPHNVLQ